jgi:glutathione-regulated potassium-efflux system ancillary protein KefC
MAIAVVKQGRQQLDAQMASERAQQAQRRPQGWGGG